MAAATLLRLAIRIAAYPNRIAGALVFGLAIAIMVNALLLQHSRHPAPLFHKNFAIPTKPVGVPAERPLPAPPAEAPKTAAPPPSDLIGHLIKSEAPMPQPRPLRAAKPAEPHAILRDPISQILRATSPMPPRPRPATEAAATTVRPSIVLGVQQALVKLGFVLRPDGRMGAVTRHALEQYERDRGLPLRSDLSPGLIRRLASEAGIRIQ